MNIQRKGDWIQTYTGNRFWPLDPFPQDFEIADIAHALANICRFGGHLNTFYSVAQHSIMVSVWSGSRHAFEGLMHDAAEAYIGDMVRPLKVHLPSFKQIERRLLEMLSYRYGFSARMSPEVKLADNLALVTEWSKFGSTSVELWDESVRHIKPWDGPICPMTPPQAEAAFLSRFEKLIEKRI